MYHIHRFLNNHYIKSLDIKLYKLWIWKCEGVKLPLNLGSTLLRSFENRTKLIFQLFYLKAQIMETSFQNFSVYFIWSFYEKIMVSKVKMCIAAIEF